MPETTDYNELLNKMEKCLIASSSYLTENGSPLVTGIRSYRNSIISGVYTKVALVFSTIMTENCTSYAQHKSIEQFKQLLEQSLILLIGVLVTDRQYDKQLITIESIVDLFNDFRKIELKPAEDIAEVYTSIDPYTLVVINELLKQNKQDEAMNMLKAFILKGFHVLITPGDLLNLLHKKYYASKS